MSQCSDDVPYPQVNERVKLPRDQTADVCYHVILTPITFNGVTRRVPMLALKDGRNESVEPRTPSPPPTKLESSEAPSLKLVDDTGKHAGPAYAATASAATAAHGGVKAGGVKAQNKDVQRICQRPEDSEGIQAQSCTSDSSTKSDIGTNRKDSLKIKQAFYEGHDGVDGLKESSRDIKDDAEIDLVSTDGPVDI